MLRPILVPCISGAEHGCHVRAGAGGCSPAQARSPFWLSPSLAARCWWNSCFDLQNADCQNILHSRRLGVTIRDAEIQGVEIPALDPARGVAGVTFALVLPAPGLLQPPECHTRPWPDTGALKLPFHDWQTPGRLMKHSRREGAMGKTPRQQCRRPRL